MNRTVRTTLLVLSLGVLLSTTSVLPVGISYTYSNSMEPTVGEYDAFLTVPAGTVQEGDIVVFWSSTREEYVTHRAVEVTADGIITQGDNNPSTDQAGGHPLVDRSDVVGRVAAVEGRPLVVPEVGHALEFVGDHRWPVVAALGALFALGALRSRSDDSGRNARRFRVGSVLALTFVAATLLVAGVVVVGASGQSTTFVAVEGDAESSRLLPVDRTSEVSVSAGFADSPLSHEVVSADGARIVARDRNGSTVNATVRIPPPTRTGPYDLTVRTYHYPRSLPEHTLRRLHGVSPTAAALVSASAALAPLYLACWLFVDGRALIRAGADERDTRRRVT